MLQLTPEQVDAVDRLQARRNAAALVELLGQAWPDVAAQLQARWPAFVETAAERARQLGLQELAEQARYASLCCLWGAGFEAKPRLEWAAEICAAPGLGPALRLHQLTQRSRETLVRRAARADPAQQSHATITPAGFDKALAAVEAGLTRIARSRGIYLDQPPPPRPQACDLGSIVFAVVEPRPLQAYEPLDASWRRVDLAVWAPAAETLTLPPEEPLLLQVLSRAAGAGPSARLQLAVSPLAACGAHHPEVQHDSAAGRLSWRGADTARLSLPLHAPPTQGQAGIGHGEPPDRQTLRIASCGIRDTGAPLGRLELALQVHAATQHLVEVRHGAAPALAWPAEGEPPAPAAVACQLEADGQTRPMPEWLKSWQGLQVQARGGLDKLFAAWSRQLHGTSGRLQAELSPLVGQAGIAWGWQHAADGSVALHSRGAIDFAALLLDLRLAGDLEWAGSRARISLQAQGRCDWRMALDQRGAVAAPGQGLEQALCSWSLPWVLTVEAIATDDPALLSAVPLAEALRGAVVGSCGLRPRPDGRGWQWFYRLAIEPVNICLLRQDPFGGTQRQQRELLPAVTLIDWSAG